MPDRYHVNPDEVEFLERTMYRRHLSRWLEYLSGYTRVQNDLDLMLSEFFSGPVVSMDLKSIHKKEEPAFHRFGLLWKTIDWVIQHYDLKPFILDSGDHSRLVACNALVLYQPVALSLVQSDISDSPGE